MQAKVVRASMGGINGARNSSRKGALQQEQLTSRVDVAKRKLNSTIAQGRQLAEETAELRWGPSFVGCLICVVRHGISGLPST